MDGELMSEREVAVQVDREKLRELCDTHYFEGTLISGTGEHLPPEECPGCAITALLSLLEQEEARAETYKDAEREAVRIKDALADSYVKERRAAQVRVRELEDALRQIEKARPTRGVPIKDTLEGCNEIARSVLAGSSMAPERTEG